MENSFDIYQLKNSESTHAIRFEGLDFLEKYGMKVERNNYNLIYQAPLGQSETLDSIYEKFNLRHPADFRGHSLSVSDIVVFHKEGKDTAYYVDSFGFKEIPEFFIMEQSKMIISMTSECITVKGHQGTWHPVEEMDIEGMHFYMLEHDTYGKDVVNVIVDELGDLYVNDVFDGFTKDIISLIQAEIEAVTIMPDPSITQDDMRKYGYTFLGMLPIGLEQAEELKKNNEFLIYALHPDGTDTAIGSEKQFSRHFEMGGMFGIDKLDWMRYLENGEYLRTAEVASEQNYVMIDGRNNNGSGSKREMSQSGDGGGKLKPSLIGRLKEKQDLLSGGGDVKGGKVQGLRSGLDIQ